MRVLVAGVTAERQYAAAFETFRNIELRDGDDFVWSHGNRGDIARTKVGEKFRANPQFDALLLCDLDQKFPKDTLEKLRAHDKDMISGHYMLRSTKEMKSLWQASTQPLDWPYVPFVDPPPDGTYRIATSGMGCVLIKRKVFEAVHDLLPPGASPFEIGKLPCATASWGNFGSDYRFFYLAQKLGFELWGTTEVDTPHASTLWITRDTIFKLQEQRKEAIEKLMEYPFRTSIRAKGMITANAIVGRIQVLQEELRTAGSQKEKDATQAKLDELSMWLEEIKANAPNPVVTDAWRKLYDPTFTTDIRTIGNGEVELSLPTFDSHVLQAEIDNRETAITGENPEETRILREQARQNQALAAVRNMNGQSPALITEPTASDLETL